MKRITAACATLALLAAAGTTLVLSTRRQGDSDAPTPAAAAPALPTLAASALAPPPTPPRKPRPRRGGMDVTFLVTADTHLGYRGRIRLPGATPPEGGIEDVHAVGIRAMNSLPGTPFPQALGGVVGEPRGLLIAGDLTEDGWPHEWARFEATFGLTGKESALRYPVFEGIGNHDRHSGEHVRAGVVRRHGAARYSWDWDDLHLVCLGEAPDDDDLAWLRDDLAATGKDLGVVLYFHYPLDGAFSKGHWFGDGDHRDKLDKALEGYPVLGIFHGHYHASGAYRWRGRDAYLVGSAKHSWHAFDVVHVTDEKMTVASWNYDTGAWWWWHEKPIFGAAGAERRWFAASGRLVGAGKR